MLRAGRVNQDGEVKKTKQKLKEVTASLIILCGFRFFPKHIIISSTWEDDWADLSCFGRYKKKKKKKDCNPVNKLTSCSTLPSPPPLTPNMSLFIAFKRSPFSLWWSDGWRTEEEAGPSRLRFPSATSFFLPPCALSHPPLAPSSPSLTIMSSSSLALPDWPCAGMAAKRGRKREREGESLWLAPFHLSRLKDQVIGFCLRIEDNCSLYSAP